MLNLLLNPAFLLGSGVIVIGAAVAWYLIVGRRVDQRARQEPQHPVPVNGGPQERQSEDSQDSKLPVKAGGAQPEQQAGADVASPAGGPKWPSITFDDVAGLSEAVEELGELQDYLMHPERFRAVGAKLPRGVLLHGPPGNGKTLLARALAGESGVPLHSVSAASFVEQYVGVGAARIRALFEQAKETTPAIVFIDEIDAVGRRRGNGDGGGGHEFDHTLNQLLVELDGTEGGEGVLILAATNRPELLDDALTRPGRFDRRIAVPQPDLPGREAILRLHAEERPVTDDVDWRRVAEGTAGLSAAELAGIVNEAALLAARQNHRLLTADDIAEAVDRVRQGTKQSRVLTDREKRRLAVHEAGHAVLTVRLRDVRTPGRISLVARSDTRHSPWGSVGDRQVVTQRELMAQLIALLGGRAAEQLVYGEPSTRAEDDLRDAAELARNMVARWAMTGRYELADQEIPATAAAPGVRKMVGQAERAATTILDDHRRALSVVEEELLSRETLTGRELKQLVEKARRPDRVLEQGETTSGTSSTGSASSTGGRGSLALGAGG